MSTEITSSNGEAAAIGWPADTPDNLLAHIGVDNQRFILWSMTIRVFFPFSVSHPFPHCVLSRSNASETCQQSHSRRPSPNERIQGFSMSFERQQSDLVSHSKA